MVVLSSLLTGWEETLICLIRTHSGLSILSHEILLRVHQFKVCYQIKNSAASAMLWVSSNNISTSLLCNNHNSSVSSCPAPLYDSISFFCAVLQNQKTIWALGLKCNWISFTLFPLIHTIKVSWMIRMSCKECQEMYWNKKLHRKYSVLTLNNQKCFHLHAIFSALAVFYLRTSPLEQRATGWEQTTKHYQPAPGQQPPAPTSLSQPPPP